MPPPRAPGATIRLDGNRTARWSRRPRSGSRRARGAPVAGGPRPPDPSRPRGKTRRVRPSGACPGGLVQRPARFGSGGKERAFKAYIVDGHKARAAAIAFELSREYDNKRKFSIASAWAARGERLLEGEPEGFAHGYQALSKSLAAEHAGDFELAIRLGDGPSNSARDSRTPTSGPGDCCSKDGS